MNNVNVKTCGRNQMEEFKDIGYKNSYSTWMLLIGCLISLTILIFTLVLKPNNFIIYFVIFLLLFVIFLFSFIIEKIRPEVVVLLSTDSVKILKGFTWKTISLIDIEYIDYKLDVFKQTQSLLFGIGDLIIENKTKKYVVGNIAHVRDCYEKITEALKTIE